MEAHVADDVLVTERDVNRAEKGIKQNKSWKELFPALPTIAATFSGEGATLVVRISKSDDLPAVRIVKEDDPAAEGATVVREIDVWNRFPFRYKQIAEILGLPSYVQGSALAKELGLKDDPNMYYEKRVGSQKVYGYSQLALDKMKHAMAEGIDIREVYRRRNTATGKAEAGKRLVDPR
ncbi:MAG: hypothetical protein JO036_21880 [Candidatus Eremiobacteraeota bacterium]|nr:hypothetical protein [Candidatus Eremiobacteraeota bacterium]